MLFPKKVRYQKQHSRKDSKSTKNSVDSFDLGNTMLFAEKHCKVTAKQIESLRLALRRTLKRQSKI
jgi:ribosomal protein L16/L10AE